jgi:fatty acid desaturase
MRSIDRIKVEDSTSEQPTSRKSQSIRNQIAKAGGVAPEWWQKSDAYGAAISLRILLPLFACLIAVPIVYGSVSPWATLVLVPLLGLFAYKVSFIMHDCAHQSLFRTSPLNTLFGCLGGYLTASNYHAYVRAHHQHHRYSLTDRDTDRSEVLGFENATKSRIAWHLTKALVGWRAVDYVKNFIFRSPEKLEGTAASPPQSNFLIGVVLTQGFIAAISTGFGRYPLMALLYPLSAATFALFFSRLRTFAEHVPPCDTSAEDFARSHKPSPVDAFFLYDSHFNWHKEHHLYPSMPPFNLSKLNERHGSIVHDSDSIGETMFRTILQRISKAA